MDVIAAIRSPVPISFAIWASSAATVLLEGLFKGAPIRRSSLSLSVRNSRDKRPFVFRRYDFSFSFSSPTSSPLLPSLLDVVFTRAYFSSCE